MSSQTVTPAPSWREDLRVLRRGPLRSFNRRQWWRFAIIAAVYLMVTGPAFLALGLWIGSTIWPPVN